MHTKGQIILFPNQKKIANLHIIEHTERVMDFRKDKSAEIPRKSVFFFGYSVSDQFSVEYHLAVILAHDLEDLFKGFLSISDQLNQNGNSSKSMRPCYMRTLLSYMKEIDDNILNLGFAQRIDQMQLMNSNEPIVFGITGELQLILLPIDIEEANRMDESNNPITYFNVCNIYTEDNLRSTFSPLLICDGNLASKIYDEKTKILSKDIHAMMKAAGITFNAQQ